MSEEEQSAVTDNPELLDALYSKCGEVDSEELGRYAVEELGIEPPLRYEDGGVPGIVREWAIGEDSDHPGVLVWALESEEQAEDDYDETGSGWYDHGLPRPEEDTPSSP
jgi:hypothetical protein